MALNAYLDLEKAINKLELVKFLKDPVFLFGKSKYVKRVSITNNLVEIDFSWTKMHITKHFPLVLKIFSDENSILYQSVPASKFEFKFSILLQSLAEDKTKIIVEAKMGAGLLADLMGVNDFRGFVKDIIDDAIDRYLKVKEEESRKITSNKYLDFTKFINLIPQEIIDLLNKGNWEEANIKLTALLTEKKDDLNLWLLKSYLCEKINNRDLSIKFFDYVISKNPKIIEGDLARVLADDFQLLKFIKK
jgi:tetratricopeptide (TPR) repeat protein